MRVIHFICSLLLLLVPIAAQTNFIENPGVDGRQGWAASGGGVGLEFDFDKKVGATKAGSLHFKNETEDTTSPHNWRQIVDVRAAKTQRFRLGVKLKTLGLKPGSKANLVAQCWDAEQKQIGFAACSDIREDSDWQDMAVVFEAPEGTAFVFLMAYLVGPGEVWWDDFVLEETTDPLSAAPAPGGAREAKYESLARGLAGDIPWEFDSVQALARAAEEGRPILVYVRCTDAKEGLASARQSIRAESIPFGDDGHRKDLLFRAGPLSDRKVAEMIKTRCVPVCSTYLLSGEGMGAVMPDWQMFPRSQAANLERDPTVGLAAPGSLRVKVTGEDESACWIQNLPAQPAGSLLEFKVMVRAKGLSTASRVELVVTLAVAGAKPVVVVASELEGSGEWRRLTLKTKAPEQGQNIIVRAKLSGRGEVWFDDFEFIQEQNHQNLMRDGAISPVPLGDPLAAFGLKSRDIITPALLFLNEKGELEHHVHRIGALSADFVDRWLRDCLKSYNRRHSSESAREAFEAGDLSRADALLAKNRSPEARTLRGRMLLRLNDLKKADRELRGLSGPEAGLARAHLEVLKGDWVAAEQELQQLLDDQNADHDEVQYLYAAVLQRQGRLDDAITNWRAAANETPFGRKSALAALSGGPRPWMSETLRAWPETVSLTEQTETEAPEDFEARESIRRLLEWQKPDGSFTGHMSTGFWDAALTAIAVDAFDAWQKKLPAAERKTVEVATAKAVSWLVEWTKQPFTQLDPFNAPYATEVLIRHQEKDAIDRVVAKILSGQKPDGNWTVYGPQRPASFNTAQCLMALCAAKKAGHEVPDRDLKRAIHALEAMRSDSNLFPYSTADGHDWMTTEHGAIGRDPLCELALFAADRGDRKRVDAALGRFIEHHDELRLPTKKLYDYFNSRGHGGYFFFYSHRNAMEAAHHASAPVRRTLHRAIRSAILAAREGDGSFMDHYMIGRAYATAMALVILAEVGTK